MYYDSSYNSKNSSDCCSKIWEKYNVLFFKTRKNGVKSLYYTIIIEDEKLKQHLRQNSSEWMYIFQ